MYKRGESVGWIIAAAVVLFFVLLLAGRAAVYFDYNGTIALKIKYLCFTIIKIQKKRKSKKRSKKKAAARKDDKKSSAERAESADIGKKGAEKLDKKKEPQKKKGIDLKSLTFDDKIELLKLALSGVGKPLKKLLKRIEFSHMSIEVICGGDDAAKTAIKFGAVNIAVGNVLGLLDSFFTLKPLDDLNIQADFQSEETMADVYFEVRLSLFAGVAAAFGLLGAFLKLNKAYKEKQAKALQKKKVN